MHSKLALPAFLLALTATPALAGASATVTIRGGQFSPSEVRVPAGKPVTLTIRNLDSTAAEFESKSLRVEKVAPPGGAVTIQLRPLNAGRYNFFDDFHPDAEGAVVAE